ncbi:hydrogenase maturation protease [bacterium]|nr:hydrogenase maturation protease [bacterium]
MNDSANLRSLNSRFNGNNVMSTRGTLLVGIGSPHGDDQIGWRVADALRSVGFPDVDAREASAPSQLLDWLEGVSRLIVCDACQARRQSMTRSTDAILRVHRWEWPTLQVTMLRSAGSHSFGLPQVLQLAERLGRLPAEVIVFGVEGSQFDAFAEVSPDSVRLLERVTSVIVAELEAGPIPIGRTSAHPHADGR